MAKSVTIDKIVLVVSEMSQRISQQKSTVVLRSDFTDLEESGLVGEALSSLVTLRELVKIGEGVFSKVRINALTGEPTAVDGFKVAALEALDRLGIEWEFSEGEQAYLDGKSNLIPAATCVVVAGSDRPALSLGKLRLKYWDEEAETWL